MRRLSALLSVILFHFASEGALFVVTVEAYVINSIPQTGSIPLNNLRKQFGGHRRHRPLHDTTSAETGTSSTSFYNEYTDISDISKWKSNRRKDIESSPTLEPSLKDAAIDTVETMGDILSDLDKTPEEAQLAASSLSTIIEALPNLRDRNPQVVLGSIITIVGQFSSFASLIVPYGTVVASVLTPLCRLVSAAVDGGGEGEESVESVLAGVVGEAFREYRMEEVASQSWAVYERMNVRMKIATEVLRGANALDGGGGGGGSGESTTALSDAAVSMISGSEFLTDGVYELERLWYFIHEGMAATRDTYDAQKGAEIASYLFYYVTISFTRMRALTLMACLYQKADAPVLALATQALIQDRIDADKTRMQSILTTPASQRACNSLYCAVHCSLSPGQRRLIESYGEVTGAGSYPGRLLGIRATGGEGRWLHCNIDASYDDGGSGEDYAFVGAVAQGGEGGTSFRYFDDTGRLFSCSAGAYILPDSDAPKFMKETKHFVNAYYVVGDGLDGVPSFDMGRWEIPDEEGKIRFRYHRTGDYQDLYVSGRQTSGAFFRVRVRPTEDHDGSTFCVIDIM